MRDFIVFDDPDGRSVYRFFDLAGKFIASLMRRLKPAHLSAIQPRFSKRATAGHTNDLRRMRHRAERLTKQPNGLATFRRKNEVCCCCARIARGTENCKLGRI